MPDRDKEGRAQGDRQCLVTGGAGFLGANLTDALLSEGVPTTVLDNLSRPGSELNVDWLRARHGDALAFTGADVRDAQAVERAVSEADVVYHFAGQTAVTGSIVDPWADFEHNALGTLNVLEAARRSTKDPVVVYASTNKVYGALPGMLVVEEETRYRLPEAEAGIDEHQPLDFHSPYGCSKGAADQYVRDYHRVYGLRTVVLRQSCVFGPRQMGLEDQGWVAWFVIAAALGLPITVFGDGKQVRDLLYIDDAVRALRSAVENIDVTAGEVYNIGGGPAQTLSVWLEFERVLEQTIGRTVGPVRYAPARVGDQRVFYCNTEKARGELEWEPTVGVEEGLERLASWVESAEPALRALFRSRSLAMK